MRFKDFAMLEMLVIKDVIESMQPTNVDGKDYAPKFDFGNIKNLQNFVTINKGQQIYPLIYCSNDYRIKNVLTNKKSGTFTFVIAVNNSDHEMSNTERLLVSFKNILLPTLKEFVKKLKSKKEIVEVGEIFDEQNYYGFDVIDNNSENLGLSEFWDAYQFDINLSFKVEC